MTPAQLTLPLLAVTCERVVVSSPIIPRYQLIPLSLTTAQVVTCFPIYLHDVLGHDYATTGLDALYPYVAIFVMVLLAGRGVDGLRKRGMRTVTARRLGTVIGTRGHEGLPSPLPSPLPCCTPEPKPRAQAALPQLVCCLRCPAPVQQP